MEHERSLPDIEKDCENKGYPIFPGETSKIALKLNYKFTKYAQNQKSLGPQAPK